MVLFDHVLYNLSPSLPDKTRIHLAALLDVNGGIAAPIERATHIISNTTDFEGCDLLKKEVACVTPYWVERSMELAQRQDANYYSADRTMIFSGIVATSANLPPGDKELISSGIMELGGAWREGLTKDVTHLFVTNTNSDKYRTAVAFRDRTHIIAILPHWFDQCWSQQMRLPTGLFEFPDPPYFKKEHDVNTYKGQILEARHQGIEHLPMDVDKSMMFQTLNSDAPAPSKSRNVWQGRIVLLASSLKLDMDRRKALEERVEKTGGIPIRCSEEEEPGQVAKVDVLITRFRSGLVYSHALKLGKTIGSLQWFLFVEKSGVLSSPRDNLLHYPAHPRPIPGFSAHEITVTNYQGVARDYLKKLIELMGAKFTPTLSGRNTVVVAAYKMGSKTTKAEEWSLPIVNHKWLEDCFIEWRNLTPAQKKYLDYTPGINYSILVGQRGVGRVGLEEDHGPLPKEPAVLVIEGEQQMKNGPKSDDALGHSRPSANSASKGALEVEEVEVALHLGHDNATESHRKSLSPSKNSLAPARTIPTLKGPDATKTPKSDGQGKTSAGVSKLATTPVRGSRKPTATDSDEEDTPRTKLDSSKKLMVTLSKRIITDDDDIVVLSSSPTNRKSPPKAVEDRRAVSLSRSTFARTRRAEPDDKAMYSKGKPASELDEHVHSTGRADTKSKQTTVPGKNRLALAMEEEEEEEEEDALIIKPKPIPASKKKGQSLALDNAPRDARDEENDSGSESETDQAPTQQSLIKGKPKPSPRTYKSKSKSKVQAKTNASSDDESDSYLELVIPDGRNTKKANKLSSPPQSVKKRAVSSTRISSPPVKRSSVARTSSIRVTAHEAPSSSSKRGRPSRQATSPASSRSPSPASKRRKTKDRVANTGTKKAAPSDVQMAISVSSGASVMQRISSRRGAAKVASKRLRDEVMPDLMNFEVERKRDTRNSAAGRRRKSLGISTAGEDHDEEEEEEEEEGQNRPQKKRKIVNSTQTRKGNNARDGSSDVTGTSRERFVARPSTPNHWGEERDTKLAKKSKADNVKTDEESVDVDVAPSGMSAWKPKNIRIMTTKVEVPEGVQTALNKLGLKFTQKPAECTHLVTNALARTEKFLCALPQAPFVLNSNWIQACADARCIVSEREYFLDDPDMEHKHGFKLVEALKRAKELKKKKKKLLEGQFFYFTPNVPVDHNLLKSVLRSLGAEGKDATPTARNLTTTRHVVSCVKDEPLWRPLAKQGKPILSQEFILSAAFRQFVDWDSEEMYVPGSRS